MSSEPEAVTAPLEGAGAVLQPDPSPAPLLQTEAPARVSVSKLTDIPEVARYAARIGAEARSLRKLAIEERVGQYRRAVAVVTFSDEGGVTAPEEYAPDDAEAAAIKAAWGRYTWPTYRPCLYTGKHLPERDPRYPWSMADPADLAVCWNRERDAILCVEERRPRDDGGKDVWIWTEWNDNVWRIAEPDTLPLFGLETIAHAATIFVHEGPKAAKAMQALIADDCDGGWRSHPWGKELRGSIAGGVAHLGWMGGAERPEATDWQPLVKAAAHVIVVADINDRAGLEAVSRISRATGMKMEALRFTDDWPVGADLADPIPADQVKAGTRVSDLLVPATWATDRVMTGGRPSFQIRRECIADWLYTVSPPLFFHSSNPGCGLTDAEVDARIRPFSDAELTARLIRQRFSAQADGVAYLPGSKPVIERNGQRLVNMWKPSRVRERKGAAWPLGRLLTHLFPDRRDRRHVARWGATLGARPVIRMEYAVLLRSETHRLGDDSTAPTLPLMVTGQRD